MQAYFWTKTFHLVFVIAWMATVFYLPRILSSPGARLSAFVDYGNVFGARDDFGLDKFRVSTGLALQWQSPMGPISISFAVPIRKEDGDQIERLQFTFGNQQ